MIRCATHELSRVTLHSWRIKKRLSEYQTPKLDILSFFLYHIASSASHFNALKISLATSLQAWLSIMIECFVWLSQFSNEDWGIILDELIQSDKSWGVMDIFLRKHESWRWVKSYLASSSSSYLDWSPWHPYKNIISLGKGVLSPVPCVLSVSLLSLRTRQRSAAFLALIPLPS